MPNDLVLITGASSDIGMALTRALLQATDATILAHGFRNLTKLEALAGEFPARVIAMQADLADAAATAAFADAVAAHGTPSALVHLPAPRVLYERFTKNKRAAFDTDMDVQVHAAVTLLQRFLPKMAKLPRARVVFMVSSNVHGVPPKFMSQYTIVKYAQLGLMRSLAAEYAATPVRINAVAPSMVETQFLTDLSEFVVQSAAAANPLGRNATPQDVIGAIQFLLSPAADYISGVSLPIAAGTVS